MFPKVCFKCSRLIHQEKDSVRSEDKTKVYHVACAPNELEDDSLEVATNPNENANKTEFKNARKDNQAVDEEGNKLEVASSEVTEDHV